MLTPSIAGAKLNMSLMNAPPASASGSKRFLPANISKPNAPTRAYGFLLGLFITLRSELRIPIKAPVLIAVSAATSGS